jgi:hypothetical protein
LRESPFPFGGNAKHLKQERAQARVTRRLAHVLFQGVEGAKDVAGSEGFEGVHGVWIGAQVIAEL